MAKIVEFEWDTAIAFYDFGHKLFAVRCKHTAILLYIDKVTNNDPLILVFFSSIPDNIVITVSVLKERMPFFLLFLQCSEVGQKMVCHLNISIGTLRLQWGKTPFFIFKPHLLVYANTMTLKVNIGPSECKALADTDSSIYCNIVGCLDIGRCNSLLDKLSILPC